MEHRPCLPPLPERQLELASGLVEVVVGRSAGPPGALAPRHLRPLSPPHLCGRPPGERLLPSSAAWCRLDGCRQFHRLEGACLRPPSSGRWQTPVRGAVSLDVTGGGCRCVWRESQHDRAPPHRRQRLRRRALIGQEAGTGVGEPGPVAPGRPLPQRWPATSARVGEGTRILHRLFGGPAGTGWLPAGWMG